MISQLMDKLKALSQPGKSRHFVAVDSDTRCLRIVQAEQVGAAPRIHNLAEVPFPEGLNPEDGDAVGRFLGGALRELRLAGSTVLMSVPRGQAVLKSLTLPPGVGKGEMPGMVQYQVQGDLPFRGEEAVIDFTVEQHYDADAARETEAPKPGQPEGVHLLVAAVRLPVVDYYRRIAAAAEVKLQRLGLRPYANVRCVDACTVRQPQESVAVVHVMADETEIDVIAGDSLSFSRSAVVKVPRPGQASVREVDDGVNAVVTEVVRSLQSYHAVQRGGQISAALVAGGTGIEPRVVEALAKRLGVQCEMFDPAGPLRLRGAEGSSAFISALGLALGYHAEDELRLDFLNPKRPVVKRDLRKVRAAAVVGAVVLVVAMGVTARAMYLGGKKAQVVDLRSKYNDLTKVDKKTKELANRVREVENWAKDGRDWIDHLAYLSCLLPSATDGYITGFTTNVDGSISIPLRAYSATVLEDTYKRINEANCYELKPGPFDSIRDDHGFRFATKMNLIIRPRGTVDLAAVPAVNRPSDDISAEQLLKKGAEAPAGQPAAGGAGPPGSSGVVSNQMPTVAAGIIPRDPNGNPYGPTVDPNALTPVERDRWDRYGRWDLDGDGKLSPEEYSVRTKVREAQWQEQQKETLRRFDRNGDGQIDKEERKLMERTLEEERRTTHGHKGGG